MSSPAAVSVRRHDRLFVAAGIAAVLTYFGARLLLKWTRGSTTTASTATRFVRCARIHGCPPRDRPRLP